MRDDVEPERFERGLLAHTEDARAARALLRDTERRARARVMAVLDSAGERAEPLDPDAEVRAIVRVYDWGYGVRCPRGHVITAEWLRLGLADTPFMAEVTAHGNGLPSSFDRLAAQCAGCRLST